MLFKDEEINDYVSIIDVSSEATDDEMNEKYIRGEVRIVTEQGRFQLTTIESIVESPDYKLNPEFQRRHRWDNIKKSRLIESFIMNVPVPPIFLYEVDYSVYEVMDGLQRLTSLYEFYKDKFPLEGLEEWYELNGKFYSQLPSQVKRGIDRRYLSSIILLKETAKTPEEAQRLKQLVFERINSGGEKLEPQETRNALYNGPLNQLCIKLARNDYFCRMWNIPNYSIDNLGEIPKELKENTLFSKMSDVELVLRFFAFRQVRKWEKSSFEQFLDYYLKEGNFFEVELLNKLEELFNETVKLVYEVFGEDAFNLFRQRNDRSWRWYQRPTKVVYDPIMQVFANHLDDRYILINNKEKLKKKLEGFYKINYTDFEGRNTGKSHVLKRTELMEDFISTFIGEHNK